MKPLSERTNPAGGIDECATRLLETVPRIMHVLRDELRRHRPAELSVPQFRVLAFLRRHEGVSLSELSEHTGSGLPTMSKAIDCLVTRGFVRRETCPADRRRVVLELTRQGKAAFDTAANSARTRVAEMLSVLSPEERTMIAGAMDALRTAFGLTHN